MLERAALIEQALVLVRRESNASLWAPQDELGNTLARGSSGEHAVNLTRAIAAYRAALTVRTRETAPAQ